MALFPALARRRSGRSRGSRSTITGDWSATVETETSSGVTATNPPLAPDHTTPVREPRSRSRQVRSPGRFLQAPQCRLYPKVVERGKAQKREENGDPHRGPVASESEVSLVQDETRPLWTAGNCPNRWLTGAPLAHPLGASRAKPLIGLARLARPPGSPCGVRAATPPEPHQSPRRKGPVGGLLRVPYFLAGSK